MYSVVTTSLVSTKINHMLWCGDKVGTLGTLNSICTYPKKDIHYANVSKGTDG